MNKHIKNWFLAACGVLAVSVGDIGCGAPVDGDESADELGTAEQAIKVDQSGNYGYMQPSGGNVTCTSNVAGSVCFFPVAKQLTVNTDVASFSSAHRSEVVNASATARGNLNTSFAGTGFFVSLSVAAPTYLIQGSNRIGGSGISKYVRVSCVTGTILTENQPGTYKTCSGGVIEINTNLLHSDFPVIADYTRELEHAVGNGISAAAGLGSLHNDVLRTSGTYQDTSTGINGRLGFGPWQKCLLTGYVPTGSSYQSNGATCQP